MIIRSDWKALTAIKWRDYLIRFVFGGLITVLVGFAAEKWGPAVAGVFLAFPAIFPASATLVQTRERDKKASKGSRENDAGSTLPQPMRWARL